MSRLAHAFRPSLETLEDRFLLAACHVGRLADLNAGNDLGNGHARGTLRYCINFANNNPGPDTIDFKVTGTIQLTSNLSSLTSDITITGPGADMLAVSGLGKYGLVGPIVYIDTGATVAISGLTITKGYNEIGPGGILNYGTLILTDSTVAQNYNYFGGGGQGGGIRNSGNMTISGSTVSGNECYPLNDCSGGGIFNNTTGVMQIQNSTISGNTAFDSGRGAGIYNKGSLDIRFSTITNNTTVCCSASGIYNTGGLYLYNTIVAGNNGGPQMTGGYSGSPNLIGGDPKLGILQYNGGHTQTHKVLQMSPALDAGNNSGAPPWDQRGEGYPRIVNGTIDIGAFEAQGTEAPTPPTRLAVLLTADFGDEEPVCFIASE